MAVLQSQEQLPYPPGDLGLPLIGTPPRVLDIDYLMEKYEKYGSIFRIRTIGNTNVVVLMGPEGNRFILSTGMHHFSWKEGWLPTFKELLGESLFVQDGEEHKQKRKLIMPAFHRQALHNYLSTMDEIAQRYMQKWENLQNFRWYEENKQLTFEIASTLLTGSEPGEMTEHLSHLFTTMTKGFITIPLRASWTPYGKALKARDELLKHIRQAVEYRQKNPTNDALSLLVQTRDEDGNSLTMDELQAQTFLMLFAGHETSASMLTTFCLMMKKHPEVWQQAKAEQARINIQGQLEMEHIKEMTYLEQILKEVERLYPPVPLGFRGVVEPFEFNGYYVPKGWKAIYPINVAHRDETVYTDPEKFDPDRFSPERNENKVPFSLVGFGGGSRICVGYAFAQLEMKIITSYLLRYYNWEIIPDQNLEISYSPTASPKDGLQVRFWRT